jgi:hypothetical protein
MTTTTCKNCKQKLEGKFCHHCGEKIVEPKDFSLKTMFVQVVDGLFNIDSKIFRTFKYLLFKPGSLSLKYVEGIRQPFMKPIQLFLVSNILFFLLLTQADILRIPAKYYFNETKMENLKNISKEKGLSELELLQKYDQISADVSKAAIILLVPLLTLILLVLQAHDNQFFGMHLIFSMHYISFFFLSCLLAVLVSRFGNKSVQLFIILINLLYLILATRTFYKNSWFISSAKSLIFLLGFVVLTLSYRALISYISFKIL